MTLMRSVRRTSRQMYWPVSTLALPVVYTTDDVGQGDDYAVLAGLAVGPRSGQGQTAPLVQSITDRIQRLRGATKVAGYHRNVSTAHRVQSHGQLYVVRHRWPLQRIQRRAPFAVSVLLPEGSRQHEFVPAGHRVCRACEFFQPVAAPSMPPSTSMDVASITALAEAQLVAATTAERSQLGHRLWQVRSASAQTIVALAVQGG